MAEKMQGIAQIDFGKSASWANMQSTIGAAGQSGTTGTTGAPTATPSTSGPSPTTNAPSGK